MANPNISFVIILTFICIAFAQRKNAVTCKAREHLRNESCPKDSSKFLACIDACDGREIKEERECKNTPECCYAKKRCVSKQKSTWFDEEKGKRERELMISKFSKDMKPTDEAKNQTQSRVSARHFRFGGPPAGLPGPRPFPGPPGGSCLVFPYNCPPVTSIEQITIPPVDIPYCLRTYCTLSDTSVEENMERCLTQPGCYFDSELYNYRQVFGHRVLPTVPVCHLAIRNTVFQQRARSYMSKFATTWNPAMTNCLIEKYYEDIYSSPRGCDMNEVIEYFGYSAKMAGWAGILEKECYLINGCWRPGKGCFYPMRMSEVYVKSSQTEYAARQNLASSQIFGRAKCQNFDMSTPEKFLKSYHTCLASGCSLDPRITREIYYYNLWNLTQSLPIQLQYISWMDISNAEMRPDNFEIKMKQYKDMTSSDLGYTMASSLNTGTSWQVNNLWSTFALANANGVSGNVFNTVPDYNPIPGNSFAPLDPLQNLPFASKPNTMSFGNGPFSGTFTSKPSVKSIGVTSCPFQPVHLYNYPPLKGSFSGCCDINLCYLPRSSLFAQRSGLSAYYTEWTQWSSCTTSCGGGVSSRTRRCVSRDQTMCDGIMDESRQCGSAACSQWGAWGQYAPCAVTCGGGQATRTRQCIGKGCTGDAQQSAVCNSGKCPTMSSWSQWSVCSTTCGEGSRTRYRFCKEGGEYGCPKDDPIQRTRCRAYCGTISWTEWSNCSFDSRCVKRRTASCTYEGRAGFCENFRETETKKMRPRDVLLQEKPILLPLSKLLSWIA